MLKFLKKFFLYSRQDFLCNHTFCYRSRNCTKCGLYHYGPEPEYTPHIIVNDKPVPAIEINGRLVAR